MSFYESSSSSGNVYEFIDMKRYYGFDGSIEYIYGSIKTLNEKNYIFNGMCDYLLNSNYDIDIYKGVVVIMPNITSSIRDFSMKSIYYSGGDVNIKNMSDYFMSCDLNIIDGSISYDGNGNLLNVFMKKNTEFSLIEKSKCELLNIDCSDNTTINININSSKVVNLINFNLDSNYLKFNSAVSFNKVVVDFNKDKSILTIILFDGIFFTKFNLLNVLNFNVFQEIDKNKKYYSLNNVISDISMKNNSCFLPNTLIETPNGFSLVENMKVGDVIIVYYNETITQKIIKNIIKGSALSNNNNYVPPIRIKKDAFGKGKPFSDLFITSEHSIFYKNAFYPSRMFIGMQDINIDFSKKEYIYYNIELYDHSIINANGLLVESYLPTEGTPCYPILDNLDNL
uniref:Hint domain-containing protein n=2 Tax=Neokomagataea TaxID=1223423 RepID=UPI002265C0F6